jgi:Uma2 family endonuclease
MIAAVESSTREWTIADLLEHFGPMPAYRLRSNPTPGKATEQDVIDIHDHEDRLCELVDGVLVEKTVGWRESLLAAALIRILGNFVSPRNLGVVAAPDGMVRLAPGLVRIPDVSFFSWDRFPNRRIPKKSIPHLAPNLAVEVLSKGNTAKEMERKLHDYFRAGVLLVWFVDPRLRTVTVYTTPHKFTVLQKDQTLDGGSVLPGFSVTLEELFAAVGQEQKTTRKPKDKDPKRNHGRK